MPHDLLDRRHGHGVYMALKAFTRTLIEQAGGLEAASSRTRVGKTQLHEYANPAEAAFMPIDIVADLEADVGAAPVTRELARLSGFTLERDHAAPATHDPSRALRRMMAELGLLADDYDRDGARGALSPNHRRQLTKEAQALIAEVQRFVDAINRDDAR